MNSECVEWNRGIAIYTAQHLASADAACGGAAELGAVGAPSKLGASDRVRVSMGKGLTNHLYRVLQR